MRKTKKQKEEEAQAKKEQLARMNEEEPSFRVVPLSSTSTSRDSNAFRRNVDRSRSSSPMPGGSRDADETRVVTLDHATKTAIEKCISEGKQSESDLKYKILIPCP